MKYFFVYIWFKKNNILLFKIPLLILMAWAEFYGHQED